MFFCLKPYIYAAYCDNGIVILDTKQDKYFSLIDDAVTSLTLILDKEFIYQEPSYISLDQEIALPQEKLNYWIDHFLTQGFIQTSLKKDLFKYLRTALKPEALSIIAGIHSPLSLLL